MALQAGATHGGCQNLGRMLTFEVEDRCWDVSGITDYHLCAHYNPQNLHGYIQWSQQVSMWDRWYLSLRDQKTDKTIAVNYSYLSSFTL